MLFPISELIKEHGDLVCVKKDTKVRDALTLMLDNDFSQLPVVDENNFLGGVVTEKSIIDLYYHLGDSVSLLDIDVDHCQTKPITISSEADIFEALDLLQNTYAIIVVDQQKPVGILTDYDTTNFFRDLTEGLIMVQDIEVTLKQYIESVFSTEDALQDALIRSFKVDESDPSKPTEEYEFLSLGQLIQLITTKGNWENFEDYFQPKKVFFKLMDQVRRIRNQLAHFRGQLEPVQLNALKRAIEWLERRPKISTQNILDDVTIPDLIPEPGYAIADGKKNIKTKGKYTPFEMWLGSENKWEHNIRLKFSTIEEVLGTPLPPSARKHRAWWANDYKSHPHSQSWLRAGWLVDDVDLSTEQVVLRQSTLPLMQLFFADLLDELKKVRPGATRATKASLANWWAFGAGKSGVNLAWVFTGDGFFRTELYIDTGNRRLNKAIFDELHKLRAEIESKFGNTLGWDRLDDKKASRISIGIPANITDSLEKLAEIKVWALRNMVKFVDIIQPLIKEIKIDVE